MSRLQLTCLSLLLFASGCATVSLRDDVLASAPLNEDPELRGQFAEPADTAAVATTDAVGNPVFTPIALLSRQIERSPIFVRRRAPASSVVDLSAIGDIATQGTEVYSAANSPEIAAEVQAISGNGGTLRTFDVSGATYLDEETPLPADVASTDVAKAFLSVARAANDPKQKVKEVSISLFDFFTFAKAVNKYQVQGTQDPKVKAKLSLYRKKKIISFPALVFTYGKAWFGTDGFVDRAGTKYSKPKIKSSIDDPTIDAGITIFLEAMFDYVLVTKHIHDPVVYTSKFLDAATDPATVPAGIPDDAVWQTADQNKPTVVAVFPEVAERLASPGEQGITKLKHQVIVYASGKAGDGGKKIAGLIAKTFAHIHASFIVGANFSVGSNDTLTKMIETFAEVSARRLGEAAVSAALYRQRLPFEKAGGIVDLAAADANQTVAPQIIRFVETYGE